MSELGVSAVSGPSVVVFSSLFPSSQQPHAGLFIRERMFRVGKHLPLCVVSPVPWFPLQSVVRVVRPAFRPGAPVHEKQAGVDVWFPRFISPPGVLKHLDGAAMARAALPRLRKLHKAGRLDLIDAHFGYPDGYAATLIGKRLNVPVTITLRGTEARHAQDPKLRPLLIEALQSATRVLSVSESLRQVAIDLGVNPDKCEVVGNGVDVDRFAPIDRLEARKLLGLPDDAKVLVSVGGLVERKGFHRVIQCLPALKARWPGLHYLVVGGASAEGDNSKQLREMVRELKLEDCVHFLGPMAPSDLHRPLSAADVFVLATRNEGWANVFLEAMACGLPVVTTNVGGNREVVCDPAFGTVVEFGDSDALSKAMSEALERMWDARRIRSYAANNDWSVRVDRLLAIFRLMAQEHEAGTVLSEVPA